MLHERTAPSQPAPSRGEGLRARHKRARRERIVGAVRELLRESPEEALTTDQIAERAEVAPATVYNLIGPREKVWEALAGSIMGELERRLAGSGARDPLGRAREVVAVTVELFVEDPAVSRRLLREWEGSGLVLDPGPLDQLRAALTDAQAAGQLRADVDVKKLTAVVRSACLGEMHRWVAGLIDDEQFAAGALLALDMGLAATAAEPHRDRFLRRMRGRRRVRPTTGKAT
jgi:AcrR family transcriptional regulator